MKHKVIFHSFKGGTGKSTIVANLAVELALKGHRVGVADLDFKGPGLHVIFGLSKLDIKSNLNDYLANRCGVMDCTIDLTNRLDIRKGKLYFLPASLKMEDILRLMKDGYEVDYLTDGLQEVMGSLNLDLMFIDSHPGFDEDTLLGMAISDSMVILSRLDAQDYIGTAVTFKILEKFQYDDLKRPILLIINKIPEEFDPTEVQKEFEEVYKRPVIGTIPFHQDLLSERS